LLVAWESPALFFAALFVLALLVLLLLLVALLTTALLVLTSTALGETRIIRISSDQLLEVDDHRIVLRLTEPEARSLPTPDSRQAQDL
jgi:hypothetical protein